MHSEDDSSEECGAGLPLSRSASVAPVSILGGKGAHDHHEDDGRLEGGVGQPAHHRLEIKVAVAGPSLVQPCMQTSKQSCPCQSCPCQSCLCQLQFDTVKERHHHAIWQALGCSKCCLMWHCAVSLALEDLYVTHRHANRNCNMA